MEEKKEFINAMELDDNMLDSVAGGAGESGYKWNDGDEVKFTNGWKCPGCNAQEPYAVIAEITLRKFSFTNGWVRYKCCGRTDYMSMGGAMKKLSELE